MPQTTDNQPIIKSRRSLIAKIDPARLFFTISGASVIVILLGIFYLLIINAIPFFKEYSFFDFIGTTRWNPTSSTPGYGIIPLLISTLYVTIGSMFLSIPIGIGAALYLSEVAPNRVREILKPVIEILASIPSVVIGFLGLVVLGPAIAAITGMPSGLNAVNGSILLAIMALPTIISLTEDSLRSVPDSFREASYALGANKWETMIKVILPSAKSGIFAAIMLGLGRAIGETMTVLMVCGNAPHMPSSFLDSVRTLTATIAIELGEVDFGSTHYHALFAVGFILFVITFIVNLAADIVLRRQQNFSKSGRKRKAKAK